MINVISLSFWERLSGFAKEEMESNSDNMMPLFEAIIRHVPPPVGDSISLFSYK